MHGAAPAVGFMISVHMPRGLGRAPIRARGNGPWHPGQTTGVASGQEHPQKVNRPGTADRPGPSVTPPALDGAEVSQAFPRLTTSSWLRE